MTTQNITFDTSCLRSLAHNDKTPEKELAALQRIIDYFEEGKIRIWVSYKSKTEITERIAEEGEENDPERIDAWRETLTKIKEFEELPGLFMLGFSHLGEDTMLASDKDSEFSDFLTNLAHPDTVSEKIARGHYFDISILVDHRNMGNDLFITRDKHFLKKHIADELRTKWDVIVCNPVGALKIIDNA